MRSCSSASSASFARNEESLNHSEATPRPRGPPRGRASGNVSLLREPLLEHPLGVAHVAADSDARQEARSGSSCSPWSGGYLSASCADGVYDDSFSLAYPARLVGMMFSTQAHPVG